DAAMEPVANTVEHDGRDARLLRGLGGGLADLDRGIDVGARTLRAERRSGSHGPAFGIVDDLRVDVPTGTVDREPRALAAALLERSADTAAAAFEKRKLGHLTSSSLPCGRCTRRGT